MRISIANDGTEVVARLTAEEAMRSSLRNHLPTDFVYRELLKMDAIMEKDPDVRARLLAELAGQSTESMLDDDTLARLRG